MGTSRAEEAVVVEVADDRLGELALVVGEVA